MKKKSVISALGVANKFHFCPVFLKDILVEGIHSGFKLFHFYKIQQKLHNRDQLGETVSSLK